MADNQNVLLLVAAVGAARFYGAANAQPLPINAGDPLDVEAGTHWLTETIIEFFGTILPLATLWVIFFVLTCLFGYIIPALVAVVLRRCIAQKNYVVLVVRALRSAIIFGGFLLAFGLIGIDIVGLFVGFGFFAVAISVGLSDPIANWASGILQQTDASVQAGDRLVIPGAGVDGVVLYSDSRQITLAPTQGAIEGYLMRKYVPNRILSSTVHIVYRPTRAAQFAKVQAMRTRSKQQDVDFTTKSSWNFDD